MPWSACQSSCAHPCLRRAPDRRRARSRFFSTGRTAQTTQPFTGPHMGMVFVWTMNTDTYLIDGSETTPTPDRPLPSPRFLGAAHRMEPINTAAGQGVPHDATGLWIGEGDLPPTPRGNRSGNNGVRAAMSEMLDCVRPPYHGPAFILEYRGGSAGCGRSWHSRRCSSSAASSSAWSSSFKRSARSLRA